MYIYIYMVHIMFIYIYICIYIYMISVSIHITTGTTAVYCGPLSELTKSHEHHLCSWMSDYVSATIDESPSARSPRPNDCIGIHNNSLRFCISEASTAGRGCHHKDVQKHLVCNRPSSCLVGWQRRSWRCCAVFRDGACCCAYPLQELRFASWLAPKKYMEPQHCSGTLHSWAMVYPLKAQAFEGVPEHP